MDLIFSSFTISHLNISRFASVQVIHDGGTKSVTVANPSSLISRKDGLFTIKAKNPANTTRVSLRNAQVVLTEHNGRQSHFVY